MRFEEAYGGWQQRLLTQEEVVRPLGVCKGMFRADIDRYEDEAILDRLIEQAPQPAIAPSSARG